MNTLNFEENLQACKSQHKFGGKILTPEDIDAWDGKNCDCGKFIVRFEGCGCPGSKKQPKYYENPNFVDIS